jgi:tetratricopeptide (TPR) repeat protein
MQNKIKGKIIFLGIFLILISKDLLAETSFSLYSEGLSFYKEKKYQEAEAKFKESIKVNQWYALPYYALGRLYIRQNGKVKDAIINLQKAIECDNNLANANFYLGLAQLISEKYIEAIHSFKRAYELDKKYAEALFNIAVIYEHLGNDYMAFFYYREYLKETEKK